MAKKEKLNALLAVVEDELVVEDDVRHLERTVADVLASHRSPAGLGKLLRPIDAQQAGAIGPGDDAGAVLGEDLVAGGVIAVMMRVEDVADRLVRRSLDRGDDVLRLRRGGGS